MDEAEALCAVLGDEARICAALTETLRREQRAVVALEADDVLASLAERARLTTALAEASSRRRAALDDVARTVHVEPAATTALLPRLPLPIRTRVRDRLRELRGTLLEARGLERQNGLLARASLATVTELLAALRAAVPGARYGADARLEAAPLAERVDRRA